MLIARSLTRAFFSSENTACAIAPLPNVYEHTRGSNRRDNVTLVHTANIYSYCTEEWLHNHECFCIAHHQDERSQELGKELPGMNKMHSPSPGFLHSIFSCFYNLDETLPGTGIAFSSSQAVVATRWWLGKQLLFFSHYELEWSAYEHCREKTVSVAHSVLAGKLEQIDEELFVHKDLVVSHT